MGKTVRFTIAAVDVGEATTLAEDLCASFLTNPVIEDSSVSVSPVGDSS